MRLRKKVAFILMLVLVIIGYGIIERVNAATYIYDNLGRIISVTTASGLNYRYTYDAGGNILTIISASQAHLAVNSIDPQSSAENVPLDQTIQIHFNKNIEPGNNFANISLRAGQDTIPINNSTSADTLYINPVGSLVENTSYTVYVPASAVKELSGTDNNNEIILQFTTTSLLGLRVIDSDPANRVHGVPLGQTIQIYFNKSIEPGNNFANISLRAGQDTIPINNSTSADTLYINPVSNLVENTSYTIYVPANAVKDLSGTDNNNEIILQFTTIRGGNAATYIYDNLGRIVSVTAASGLNYEYTYDAGGNILTIISTGQDYLEVNSTDPQDAAENVPLDQTIQIRFNKNIESANNFANISLMMGQDAIPINNLTSADTLYIDPISSLAESASYTVYVPASAVKELSGTDNNNEITLQFTTTGL